MCWTVTHFLYLFFIQPIDFSAHSVIRLISSGACPFSLFYSFSICLFFHFSILLLPPISPLFVYREGLGVSPVFFNSFRHSLSSCHPSLSVEREEEALRYEVYLSFLCFVLFSFVSLLVHCFAFTSNFSPLCLQRGVGGESGVFFIPHSLWHFYQIWPWPDGNIHLLFRIFCSFAVFNPEANGVVQHTVGNSVAGQENVAAPIGYLAGTA